jgi:ABC-type glycerol-3-phosphate transport system permease component
MISGRRRALRYTVIYAGLAPFLLIALFPVVWMAITAFKHDRFVASLTGGADR